MYATFEDFIENQQQQQQQQQQQHPSPSELTRSTPPFPVARGDTPPPPPAPSHSGGSSSSTRRKMSSRSKRRRAASGGGSSGSRDDVSSTSGGGGAASDSCTPLVATIRSIQESRRGGTASGVSSDDVDESFPPGPAPHSHRSFPAHLSPASTGGGLHPNSMDALSCSGYAGTNSIDSGYKSACPTPDLSDSFYPESLFLRSSSGGLISPRPRITMGTRMMSRGARVGSDPAYYEDIDPSQVPGLFQRRPSTSPGPRSGSNASSRPRSASTGSRSSPTTLGGTRRALRSSPHMSSTGSLTSSGLPYSRHSSPGGTYSSPGGISPAPRKIGSPHLVRGAGSINSGIQTSSSQLALLEREIDALLTGTSSEAAQYPPSEGSQDLSQTVGFPLRLRDPHDLHFRAPEEALASSPQGRPPHPPTRLRGSSHNSRAADASSARRPYAFDAATRQRQRVKNDDAELRNEILLKRLRSHDSIDISEMFGGQQCCRVTENVTTQQHLEPLHQETHCKHSSKGMKSCKCNCGRFKLTNTSFLTSVTNNNETIHMHENLADKTIAPTNLERFISKLSVLQSSTHSQLTRENVGKLDNIVGNKTPGSGLCEESLEEKNSYGANKKETNKRNGRICRKGTPYPHPPSVTVEQNASGEDVNSVTADSRTRSSDNSSSVDDLDLDTATVISCSDRMSSSSLSTGKTIQNTSRSFEDLPKLSSITLHRDAKEWPHRKVSTPTLEEIYHYHMYEAILYGEGQAPPCDVPRIPSPPPLPSRPPHLMPPNHMTTNLTSASTSSARTVEKSDLSSTTKDNSNSNPGTVAETIRTKNENNQLFNVACSDPNCREFCPLCDCTNPQVSSNCQPFQLNTITQGRKTDISSKTSIQSRTSKLQKIGAVIRKSLLPHDRSILSPAKSADLQEKMVLHTRQAMKKQFCDLTIGEVRSGKLDCGCDIDACYSQSAIKLCSNQNQDCIECLSWKCQPIERFSVENPALIPSNHNLKVQINETKCNETTDQTKFATNIVDTTDIPLKAKVTLGIIDPQTVQKKTTRRDFQDLQQTSEVKSGAEHSVADCVEEQKVTKNALVPNHENVASSTSTNTKSQSPNVSVKQRAKQASAESEMKESKNESHQESSPPPTPPPHAAFFLHDVEGDSVESGLCGTKSEKTQVAEIPEPPPRTTSVFAMSVHRENAPSIADQESLGDPKHKTGNKQKNISAGSSCSVWERLNPLKPRATQKDVRKPLPPLPSRAPRSISVDRNIQYQKHKENQKIKMEINNEIRAPDNNSALTVNYDVKISAAADNLALKSLPLNLQQCIKNEGYSLNSLEKRNCSVVSNSLANPFICHGKCETQHSVNTCCYCYHSNMNNTTAFPVNSSCRDPLCPDLTKGSPSTVEQETLPSGCSTTPCQLQERAQVRASPANAVEASEPDPPSAALLSVQGHTSSHRPVPCPRIFSLPVKRLDSNNSPTIQTAISELVNASSAGEPNKSGSLIQPMDDEYGFNVASYLI